ncbi:hypothetical protein BXZ70DRAFT_501642 [Cristinia sonorae]|uniref:CFEM domain-containing protein n=1 Tax=Cristinia sonorae TaxID=1940300 RepID=A0A8K0XLE8_9AGAR|nr:hypothetical protein BXZ70DRAFT_501642 [Cristinia sonorae]
MFVSVLALCFAFLVTSSLAQSLTFPPITDDPASSTTGTRSSTLSRTSSGSSSPGSTTTPTSTSSAEFPSLSGYSPCGEPYIIANVRGRRVQSLTSSSVSNCLGTSVSDVGCISLVDVQCFCTNATRFTASLVGCINANCTADLGNAEKVANQFCALATPNVTLSFPSPTSSSSSSSSTSPSSTPSTTNTSASDPPAPTETGGSHSLSMDSAFGSVVFVGVVSAIAAVALGW